MVQQRLELVQLALQQQQQQGQRAAVVRGGAQASPLLASIAAGALTAVVAAVPLSATSVAVTEGGEVIRSTSMAAQPTPAPDAAAIPAGIDKHRLSPLVEEEVVASPPSKYHVK